VSASTGAVIRPDARARLGRDTLIGAAVGAAVGAFALGGAPGWTDFSRPASGALVGFVLASAAVSDLRTRRIPNRLIFGGLAAACVLAALGGSGALASSLAGLGFAVALSALTVLSGLFTRAGSRAVGMGDLKLFLFIGLALGLPRAAAVVLVGVLAAATQVGALHLTRRNRDGPLPLGPALAVGGLLAMSVPDEAFR
jgi:Flp pilus assembly protein protease CpaA